MGRPAHLTSALLAALGCTAGCSLLAAGILDKASSQDGQEGGGSSSGSGGGTGSGSGGTSSGSSAHGVDRDVPRAVGMAAAGGTVYWADGLADAVLSLPATGGTPTTLATDSDPEGIAIDATSVYWTNSGSPSGTVVKVALSGGALTTLVSSGLTQPSGIAVDATSVYFARGCPEDGGLLCGAVMKLTPK